MELVIIYIETGKVLDLVKKKSSLPCVYVCTFNSGICTVFDLPASTCTNSSTNVTVALDKENKR